MKYGNYGKFGYKMLPTQSALVNRTHGTRDAQSFSVIKSLKHINVRMLAEFK